MKSKPEGARVRWMSETATRRHRRGGSGEQCRETENGKRELLDHVRLVSKRIIVILLFRQFKSVAAVPQPPTLQWLGRSVIEA